MGTQADRWEVRDGLVWLDGVAGLVGSTRVSSAIAALLDEVRGDDLPDGVKPGYVLERATVLADGWRLLHGSFFAGRGPWPGMVPVEPIPAPATELVPLHELIGRTLPGEAQPVSEFSVRQRPDVVGWEIHTYCGHIVNVDTDTDGMVEVQVES